jgi:hypothetical protein
VASNLSCFFVASQLAALKPSCPMDISLPTVGANAASLLQSLPSHSPLRQPLIHTLANGLSQSEATHLFHISKATYYRSMKNHNELEQTLLNLRYPVDTTKEVIHKTEQKIIETIIKNQCPPRSGVEREAYSCYTTKAQLYQYYQNEINEQQLLVPVRCYNSFIEICNQLNVSFRDQSYAQFNCLVFSKIQTIKKICCYFFSIVLSLYCSLFV